MSKPTIVLLLSLLLLAGCQSKGSDNPSSTSGPKTSAMAAIELTAGSVMPGEGINELKLGATRAEVEQALGAPTGHDANEFVKGQTFLLYHTKGIELTLQDDVVEMITLHSKNEEWTAYPGATDKGVGVTSTAKEVEAAHGTTEDAAARALRYPNGVVFRFDVNREGDGSNSRVESVSVVAAGSK